MYLLQDINNPLYKNTNNFFNVHMTFPEKQSLVASTRDLISMALALDLLDLRLNDWYLDDGVLSGHPASVSRALDITPSGGPPQGFHVNLKKCELFSPNDVSVFPTSIPSSNVPNF